MLISAKSKDTSKIIIVNLNIKNDNVTLLDKNINFSHPPNIGLQPNFFIVKLIATDKKIIKEFGIWDPRLSIGDEIIYYENGTMEFLGGIASYIDDVNFTVTIPFYKNIEMLNLYENETGEELISVYLRDIVLDFCEQNPNDPDCVCKEETPILYILFIIFIVLILITLYVIKIRKR